MRQVAVAHLRAGVVERLRAIHDKVGRTGVAHLSGRGHVG